MPCTPPVIHEQLAEAGRVVFLAESSRYDPARARHRLFQTLHLERRFTQLSQSARFNVTCRDHCKGRFEFILGKSLFGNVFLDQSNIDPSLCHSLQYVSVFFLLRLTGPSRAVAGVLPIFLR